MSELFQNRYRIKSTRFPEWDYSSDGWYFVTICTKDRECFFGEIRNGIMGLNKIGCMVAKFWQEIPQHFPFVVLDEFVVMPNHIHGIVVIKNDKNDLSRRDAPRRVSTRATFGPLQKNSLSSIINHFKGNVTRWCRKNGFPNFAWQPRFYDHIIRNEKSLNRICEYIIYNPLKWEWDRNNSEI